MLRINEWLPNPEGADADGEWIELLNDGAEAVQMRGWSLRNASGKRIQFREREVGPEEYLVLRRSDTKLTLRNNSEILSLYDRAGNLVDQSAFKGTAPEGKSYSRRDALFFFSEPTPGAINKFSKLEGVIEESYPMGGVIANSIPGAHVAGLAIGVGIIFAAAVIFVIQRSHGLPELLFSRHEKIR